MVGKPSILELLSYRVIETMEATSFVSITLASLISSLTISQVSSFTLYFLITEEQMVSREG